MTVELLAYANRQKVAEALTERGYSVTRMTVNRWAKGGEMPAIATRMILALFGHDPDTTKAAAPEWAAALARDTAAQVIEALAPADRLRAAQGVISRLEALQGLGDEVPAGSDEGQDQDVVTQQEPERG